MNNVILLGRIGKDPELKKVNEFSLVEFSLATSRRYKKGEEMVEDTQWHNIKFWGKTADIIEKYFKKGSRILVTGRIETRSWDDKEGVKKYTTEIIGETFQFIDKAESSNTNSQSKPSDNSNTTAPPVTAGTDDDDLPF